MKPHERIIFALDVSSRALAYKWCARFEGKIGMVKIGLELFTKYGPDIFDAPTHHGLGIMLDLKLHDIPNTVSHAIRGWGRSVRFITVHASGGSEMLKEAVRFDAEGTGGDGRIAAVTVLTSLNDEGCSDIYGASLKEVVPRLAGFAVEAGCAALVCSGHEIKGLREKYPNMKLIVPGIRPIHADSHDQKRIITPREAIAHGADYLVVGRYLREDPYDVEARLDTIIKGIVVGRYDGEAR